MALSAIRACRYTAPVTFGENLRRARLAAKPRVTQETLAERIGHKNNSTVSKWETEDLLPEPDTVERVATALGIAPSVLLQDVELPYDRLRGRDLIDHGPDPRFAHAERAASPRLQQHYEKALQDVIDFASKELVKARQRARGEDAATGTDQPRPRRGPRRDR